MSLLEKYNLSPQQGEAFREALDLIRKQAMAEVGESDLSYMRQLNQVAELSEVAGRLLLHFSLDPISYALGVACMTNYYSMKIFIGHTVGHKCYDRMQDADGLRSNDVDSSSSPMSIALWMKGHNQHHVHTDVHNLDPDMHHNPWLIRLHGGIPWTPFHLVQLPFFLSQVPTAMWGQTLYYHGLFDPLKGKASRFFMPEMNGRDYLQRVKNLFKESGNHVAKDYVFYPALAGPLFGKVLAGNMLAESLASIWIGMVVFGTHYGANDGSDDDAFFADKAENKAEWYLRQFTCTTDIKLPKIFDHQTGALNLHVCHHLFPALPPNRLISVKPKVKALCEEYGVPFREHGVVEVYGNIVKRLARFSVPKRWNLLSAR